jgi:DNA primase catalytic subunit
MEDKTKEDKKRVQLLARSYYSRKDIQKIIFGFCKNRETIPRYLEGFGKRPDSFDYPNDIITYARRGATSFHCSEEIWSDPQKINTNMKREEYDELRIGWDFLIDIDSKYLDYSKIAAKLLVEELEKHKVINVGIKFSGSKGFHILIPFKSFPKTFGGELTKEKFPEWPRLIADYLKSRISSKLNSEIFKISNPEELEKKGLEIRENLCPICKGKTTKKNIGIYKCPNFRCRTEVKSMKSNRKEMICPSCNDKMKRIDTKEVYFCENCKTNSEILKSSVSLFGDNEISFNNQRKEIEFVEELNAEKAIDSVDIVLVSSRHLFRTPYSLHEKTALASVVISKEELENFKPSDADPLKIKDPKSFMPESMEDEAKELLFQAVDNSKKKEEKVKKYVGENINLKGLKITEDIFPPIILKILKGIKNDGRKRALYILLSFFNSLDLSRDYIEERIYEWNAKNKIPLKEGYVKSQIEWSDKRKILPPNYDKPIYQEFGELSKEELSIKNPINFTIKRALRLKSKREFDSVN